VRFRDLLIIVVKKCAHVRQELESKLVQEVLKRSFEGSKNQFRRQNFRFVCIQGTMALFGFILLKET